MKISFLCGHCRSELAVPATAAGQGARCPNCQTVVLVPQPQPEPPSRPKAVPLHVAPQPTEVEPPRRSGPAWEVVDEPDDTHGSYSFRSESRSTRPAPEPVREPDPVRLPAPSKPTRTRRFECLQCGHLIVTTTSGAFVECPRCDEEHSAAEVKDGAKRWSAAQRRMRDRGDTPETMWQSRFLWYYLAGMAAFAGLAAVVLGVTGGGLAGAIAGMSLFLALPLAFIVMAFIAMDFDARRGEPLGMGNIILFFLFFGMLFLLLYSLMRVTRYPQLILAFLLWPLSLLLAFALVGLAVLLGDASDRGRNNPPPVPRPEFRPPVVQPPKPAGPKLPPYTRPGEVARADEIPGAVTYWRFDEGEGEAAADAKSLATGTLRGARWVAGIRGNALAFDGRADWFEFGQNTPLRFGDNAPFTVSCWVKPTSLYGPVFSFRGEKHRVIDTATIVGVWVENGKLCSWMRKDGSIMFPNEQFSGDELVPNEWHHVAVVRHRGGAVEVYQDGLLATRQESGESDGAFTLKYGSLGREMFPHHRTGERDDPTTKHLEGAVDEFAAFDRALTPAEIAKLAGR